MAKGTLSIAGADTLTAADLAPDSVGASEIAAGAVGSTEIADDAVTTDKLANSIVSDITNGKYKLLKWDKQERKYYSIDINLHEKGDLNESN